MYYLLSNSGVALSSSKAPLGISQNRRVGGISSYWAIIFHRFLLHAVFSDIAEYNDIAVFGNRTKLDWMDDNEGIQTLTTGIWKAWVVTRNDTCL